MVLDKVMLLMTDEPIAVYTNRYCAALTPDCPIGTPLNTLALPSIARLGMIHVTAPIMGGEVNMSGSVILVYGEVNTSLTLHGVQDGEVEFDQGGAVSPCSCSVTSGSCPVTCMGTERPGNYTIINFSDSTTPKLLESTKPVLVYIMADQTTLAGYISVLSPVDTIKSNVAPMVVPKIVTDSKQADYLSIVSKIVESDIIIDGIPISDLEQFTAISRVNVGQFQVASLQVSSGVHEVVNEGQEDIDVYIQGQEITTGRFLYGYPIWSYSSKCLFACANIILNVKGVQHAI